MEELSPQFSWATMNVVALVSLLLEPTGYAETNTALHQRGTAPLAGHQGWNSDGILKVIVLIPIS